MVTTWPPSDKHLKRNNISELKYNQGGSRISRGGGGLSSTGGGGANLLFGQFFCEKLHENEENPTGSVKILLCRSATDNGFPRTKTVTFNV